MESYGEKFMNLPNNYEIHKLGSQKKSYKKVSTSNNTKKIEKNQHLDKIITKADKRQKEMEQEEKSKQYDFLEMFESKAPKEEKKKEVNFL